MEPIGEVNNPGELDPVSLGFMCGLEIHQQLATDKLHSRMPSELFEYNSDESPNDWPRSTRRLRASRGEGGATDVAARFEQRRNRTFEYVQSPNSGLVELDESPPRNHDTEAVDIVLTMAALMGAKPIPYLQAMRKTVVDGSNTSGFQRTTIVATDGIIEIDSSQVGIDLISLEEDSARKLETRRSENGETVVYNLDRLGVPLVEVATAPDVRSPEHAKETALALGRLLRDTRMVRRGLGSIRQDLNVSISCGDRVEIKGCQDLDWIPRIIQLEMARQLHFYRLANELRSDFSLPPLLPDRESDSRPVENRVEVATTRRIPYFTHDVTALFSECDSDMVTSSIQNGSCILGISLPGFSGKIGKKTTDEKGSQLPRLGREFASAAKLAGVSGILHSDELPAYGISEAEVDSVRSQLSLSEADAFVLCIAPKWQSELALEAVIDRARLAFHRIPREVRNVVVLKGKPEDGTTTALRPLPGGARMYPETDIPVLEISPERWNSICHNLPMSAQDRKNRLSGLGLSKNQEEALLNGEIDDFLFEGIEGHLKLPAKAWASALLDKGTSKPNSLAATVHLREEGLLTREGADTLLFESDEGPIEKVVEAMASEAASRGFVPADQSSVEGVVEEVITERYDFVHERGYGAIGPLMGTVMSKLGGAADGKVVSKILKQKISEMLND